MIHFKHFWQSHDLFFRFSENNKKRIILFHHYSFNWPSLNSVFQISNFTPILYFHPNALQAISSSENFSTKSIKDFFSKCDQIRSFQEIWSHLLKKSLMENFIFCAVPIALLPCILASLWTIRKKAN